MKEKSSKAAGVTYTITGVIEEVDDTKLKITELPVLRWTYDYQQFLESLYTGKDKAPPFLEVITYTIVHSHEFQTFFTFFSCNRFT